MSKLYNKKEAASKLVYALRTFYRYLAQTEIVIGKGLIDEDGLELIRVAFEKLHAARIKNKFPPLE